MIFTSGLKLTAAVTAFASLIYSKLTKDEATLLASILVRLGEALATLITSDDLSLE